MDADHVLRSLAERLNHLESDLKRSFDEVIHQQVQRIQTGLELDLEGLRHSTASQQSQLFSASLGLPSPGARSSILRASMLDSQPLREGSKHVISPRDTWVLKEETWVMDESTFLPENSFSVGSLLLQRSLDATAKQQLRMNSYLMELSLKASSLESEKTRFSRSSYKGKAYSRSRSVSGGSDWDPWCPVFQPNSRFRVAWDVATLLMLLIEAFILPVSWAWWDQETVLYESYISMDATATMAFLNMSFWFIDLILNFNTGFYVMGQLQRRRPRIAYHYITSWFLFDFALVTVDLIATVIYVTGEPKRTAAFLQPRRILRFVQTLRIFRFVRAGKVTVLLEGFMPRSANSLVLAFTVFKTLFAILIMSHIMACGWYALGRWVQMKGESWLDVAQVSDAPANVQYVHALGNILLMPSPPPLLPQNGIEHWVFLILFVTVVLVIGSALSILTGALNEARLISSEQSRKRRELLLFMQQTEVDTELLLRVMSYADYKILRRRAMGYDTNLISPKLEAELATCQLGRYLLPHGIFQLTAKCFPAVFADFCRALECQFFCELETVFSSGFLAEKMYITSLGEFTLSSSSLRAAPMRISDEVRLLSEIALYANAVLHPYTLETESFAEVQTLSASALASILSLSPPCATVFLEYAAEYISNYAVNAEEMYIEDIVDQENFCAKKACEQNSLYVERNVNAGNQIRYLDLSYLQKRDPDSMENSMNFLLMNSEQEVSVDHMQSSTLIDDGNFEMNIDTAMFVEVIQKGAEPASVLLPMLRKAFVELDLEDGLHCRFSDNQEQGRAESSILSLIALVRNNYAMYTAPQDSSGILLMDQWAELRRFLEFAEPTDEQLKAVIFLLAVRGVGKFKSLTRQLPGTNTTDQAVRYILNHFTQAIPSATELKEKELDQVGHVLDLQDRFNFAQMLQGENVPANLRQLQGFILNRGGEELLKFYVLYLLGFMSGLGGGQGSRFMTSSNAKTTCLGLSMLRRVLSEDPAPLYWTYIHRRGALLQLHPERPVDLALVRLACLCRVHSPSELRDLQTAWDQLSHSQQNELTRHFLGDGISTSAVVLQYLPLCLERAKANPFVTVRRLLEVLVDLLRAIYTSATAMLVTVDLADLAAFVLMVQNNYVFQTCLSRARLKKTDQDRFVLEVTQENWRRVTDPYTDTLILYDEVQDLHRSAVAGGIQGKASAVSAAGSSAQPIQSYVHCHF